MQAPKAGDCAGPSWHRPGAALHSQERDADLGEWGPPEIIFKTGLIPDEFEPGGGVE